MRLNVGSGDHYQDGWTNVDTYDGHRHDELWSICEPWPYGDETVERIYAGHVIEHLTPEQAKMAFVEALRVLQPGGTIMVVAPDMERCDDQFGPGHVHRAGGHRWPGDEHQWETTERAVADVMAAVGLTVTPVAPSAVGRLGFPIVSPDRWQLAVLGQKLPA